MENNSNTITVKTIVNAPVKYVWDLWTSPQHIINWNNASPDWHTPYAENDLQIGGRFKSTMAAKDESMQFDFEGTYTNVIVNESIEYTLDDDRKVKITFKNNGDSTELIETFDPENENTEELQKSGWQAILDNFKAYAEEQKSN